MLDTQLTIFDLDVVEVAPIQHSTPESSSYLDKLKEQKRLIGQTPIQHSQPEFKLLGQTRRTKKVTYLDNSKK